MRADSINPADLLLADGTVCDLVPLDFPHIPGTYFAGTVTKLGSDVDGFEVFVFGAPLSYARGVGIAAVASGRWPSTRSSRSVTTSPNSRTR
ncbi:alcohol dehydrogenase catalytic domain-containing protein [Nonomuraea jabiensis]|uniref:alcohol dehydrogenase catalytic domain-containing protein n=1 Tax=Nonomuraea jabiensis TaxID=882448 RepID=UPI003695896D